MSMSNKSVQGKVFDSGPNFEVNAANDAKEYGVGGIYYYWDHFSETRNFPDDVKLVYINIPCTIEDCETFVSVGWPVRTPLSNGSLWRLSGTFEAPILSPSLHLIDVWHGWLENGNLRSC
jgi:hypothetical protein